MHVGEVFPSVGQFCTNYQHSNHKEHCDSSLDSHRGVCFGNLRVIHLVKAKDCAHIFARLTSLTHKWMQNIHWIASDEIVFNRQCRCVWMWMWMCVFIKSYSVTQHKSHFFQFHLICFRNVIKQFAQYMGFQSVTSNLNLIGKNYPIISIRNNTNIWK